MSAMLLCACGSKGENSQTQEPAETANNTTAELDGSKLSNPVTEGEVTTWDCVYFGNYWQKDTNGDGIADQNDEKEPIKWRVLSVEDDDAFLLADQCLDCQSYNETDVDVTWETCTLRTWLNTDFFNEAFSSAEQSAIKKTTVVNEDNPTWKTKGGENTEDRVYLLSMGEVSNASYGFDSTRDKTREAVRTEYAENHADRPSSDNGNSWWRLRTPGIYRYYASCVSAGGYVFYYGAHVYYNIDAVRPALHLDLSSAQWSKAGTVSSDGAVSEKTGKSKGKRMGIN